MLQVMENYINDTLTKLDEFQDSSNIFTTPLETNIAVTPHKIVHEVDRVKLQYYKPRKINFKIPLLITYALINRETMLDLQPERSVIATLLDQGIEIYMIEWGYPTRKDQFQTIGDHVNGYMDTFVDFIRSRHDQIPQINLMGICMGGTFSTIYAALYPEKVKNLVTSVTPTNFDTDKGLLHIWMKNNGAELLGKHYKNMPGDLMNLGFLLLNPARLMIDKYVGFVNNMEDIDFVENFFRMEQWIFDSPDLPGATFEQFVNDCYKNNLLIQNKMEVDGKRIDLNNITMPLLNFFGKYDHLVPPEACDQLIKKVASKDASNVCLNTGHIGIYVSSKCQKAFAPKIASWLKQRDN